MLDDFPLLRPGWRDLLEIAIVAFFTYRVLLLFHGMRAMQILTGIVILSAAYATAWMLKLETVTYLLDFVFTIGPFALLILFAPELRAALAQLGTPPLWRFFGRLPANEMAEEVVEALERLAGSRVGAIIALERDVPLTDYLETGSEMQARVSADLLTTIFTPYSPLHDGAVIIREDVIVGAGCILPLSQAQIADRTVGTRHRAALGLSEASDAAVLVVSEETATISLALRGRLWRHLSTAQLRDVVAGRRPEPDKGQPILVLPA